jgi:bifunctional isochorismate lyase/aryl carrier protein
MGLPKISHYALPSAHDVAAPRVPWTVDRNRAALLIHDMQRYFVNPFEPDGPPMVEVITNIDVVRRSCDEAGIPVFYSVQPGAQQSRERGLQRDFWGPGMSSADEHRAIVDTLSPLPHHRVVTKWRYSAFHRTTLETDLQALGRDQLIVTGVYASIGCLLTASDAFMRDIEPFFVADAMADFSRERHDAAVLYVAERCGVVTATSRLLSDLHVEAR